MGKQPAVPSLAKPDARGRRFLPSRLTRTRGLQDRPMRARESRVTPHLDTRTARLVRSIVTIAVVAGALAIPGAAVASRDAGHTAADAPDLGPNVTIFDPSMSTSEIKATVDAIAAEQIPNHSGRTLRPAVQARHVRHARAAAQLPGRLLHRGRRPRPARRATSSSTAPSRSTTSASGPATASRS